MGKWAEFGVFIIRLGVGIMFVYHGAPMMAGGPEKWQKIGEAIVVLGVQILPKFWGFMASFAELFGGIGLILGLFFKPACILMAFTMLVAGLWHLSRGDGFGVASHALTMLPVFIGLLFIGPGKYRLKQE